MRWEEVMKNGRRAIKGKCPTCGTVMFKILGGQVPSSIHSAAPATVRKTRRHESSILDSKLCPNN